MTLDLLQFSIMAQAERTCKFLVSLILVFSLCFTLARTQIQHDVAEVRGCIVEDNGRYRLGEDEVFIIEADVDVRLRLFGDGFTPTTVVSFTAKNASHGDDCDDLRSTDLFHVETTDLDPDSATVVVNIPLLQPDEHYYYICIKDTALEEEILDVLEGEESPVSVGNDTGDGLISWVHQGSEQWLRIVTEPMFVKKTIFPLWLQIIFIGVLLCCSGTFSGLNLGLMSLDKTELQIVANCGSEKEKRYAKTIAPLRARGNLLLCTILLGNVLVNNTLAILMDDLTGSGPIAIITATAGIVVFGEIIPQAVCSRYGLAIGAKTIWFTRIFMVVTFPVSFPISKLLDCILGDEVGTVYNRYRLRELIMVTQQNTDLRTDEIQIIAGALELSKKTVKDVMTKIEDVYMIEYNAVLDFETMTEIMKTGYTRIPVYEKERKNIVNLLNIKDLAFIDPDDRTPLKTVCKFYNHPVNYVFEDIKLDAILEEFKKGRSHMSFVQRVNNEGPGDPYYETLGVVTLEDVIEEIIQSEIVDETDTVTDNQKRMPRQAQAKDFSVFNQPDEENYPRLSPQLALATYQYLSTSVPAFKAELISETVLQRLLKKNILVQQRLKMEKDAPENMLYKRGCTADYFVLILQGHVDVDIGKEHMTFEGGPFMHFGMQALSGMPNSMSKQGSASSISSASESIYSRQPQYTPDFDVKAISDLQFLKIRRAHYNAARRATMMERQPRTPDGILDDPFASEWNRVDIVDSEKVKLELNNKNDKRTRSDTKESLDATSNVSTPLMSNRSPPGESV